MTSEIEVYETYLKAIEKTFLKRYFEQQKEYLHCKKGCSYCCKNGQYPISQIEFEYLLIGYNALSNDMKEIIKTEISKVKRKRQDNPDKDFTYACPFLLNNECSIYEYRPIICRTHGLSFFLTDESGKTRNKIPYCVNLGLNYSNVYDKESKTISLEKWKTTGICEEPVAYNLSLKALMKNDITKELELEFGGIKALIDYL
jgi:Fe-S-cluster containining protein